MIKREDIIADLHTHTIASGHAFSTIKENVTEAKNCGLKYLAITDHFYGREGSIPKKDEVNMFNSVDRMLKTEKYINVIGGVELNMFHSSKEIMSLKDTINWRLMSLHDYFVDVEKLSFTELLQEYENVLSVGLATAFAHPERELHRIRNNKFSSEENWLADEVLEYLENMVQLAYDYDIPLEVNESSLNIMGNGTVERLKYWINIAKDLGCLIYLGTDAHYCDSVGKFDKSIELLNGIGYSKENILNCNEKVLRARLKLY